MGCCHSKCNNRAQLGKQWSNCDDDECRADIAVRILADGIIKLPTAITSVDYRHRLLYSKALDGDRTSYSITYYVVVCNDVNKVKKLKSDKDRQYVLITRLSYLQILSSVDQSVIVFDYYEIESALS